MISTKGSYRGIFYIKADGVHMKMQVKDVFIREIVPKHDVLDSIIIQWAVDSLVPYS